MAALIGGLFLMPTGTLAATTQTLPLTGNTGASPLGIAIDSVGDIYTANQGAGNVSRIIGSTGELDGRDPWIPSPANGVTIYRGIAFDAAGSLFLAGANGLVGKWAANGDAEGSPWPAIVGTGPDAINAIALDPVGNLYVTNDNDGTVDKITPGGQRPDGWPVAVGVAPYAITLDSVGNVYSANFGENPGGSAGTVSKVTPEGLVTTSFGTTGVQPSGITADSAGNVYAANCGSFSATPAFAGSISRITPAGTSVPSWASLGANTCPRAITIDSAGNFYTANNVSDSISKVTPGGSVSELVSTTGDQPVAITIDSAGNLYTANEGANTVTKVNPAPGDGVAPAPPDIPATPSAVAGSGSATVTVTANSVSARFGSPSSYTLQAVQDGAKGCTVTPPATSCQVTGLTGGTSYTFIARANLDAWQTGASSPSNAVTPAAPDPDPGPGPSPDPDPTPTPSLSVTSLKAKVLKKSVSFSSKATISGAGTISQKAKQGKKVWCTASKTASRAGTYELTCNLGKKGRSALKKKALKLSVNTTFKPGEGSPVLKPSTITIKRKR